MGYDGDGRKTVVCAITDYSCSQGGRMAMAENGKTKAELDREAGERAYRRFLELTGDTRTDMERQADVGKIYSTPLKFAVLLA